VGGGDCLISSDRFGMFFEKNQLKGMHRGAMILGVRWLSGSLNFIKTRGGSFPKTFTRVMCSGGRQQRVIDMSYCSEDIVRICLSS
jgi:hypothetical protein